MRPWQTRPPLPGTVQKQSTRHQKLAMIVAVVARVLPQGKLDQHAQDNDWEGRVLRGPHGRLGLPISGASYVQDGFHDGDRCGIVVSVESTECGTRREGI